MRIFVLAITLVISLAACRRDNKTASEYRSTAATRGSEPLSQPPEPPKGEPPPKKTEPIAPPRSPSRPGTPRERCIEAACGSVDSLHFRWFNNNAEAPQFTKFWQNSVLPRVREIQQREAASWRQFRERLKDFLTNNNAKISLPVRRLLVLLSPAIMKSLNENIGGTIEWKAGKLTIHEGNFKNNFASSPAYQRRIFRAYIKQLILPYTTSGGGIVDHSMLETARMTFPQLPAAEALKAYAKHQLLKYSIVEKAIPLISVYYNPGKVEILKLAANGLDLSLEHADLAMAGISILDAAYESMRGDLALALEAAPYKPRFQLSKAARKKYLSEITDKAEEEIALFDRSCRAKMAFSYNNQVSSEQYGVFVKLIEDVRQAAKSVVGRFARNASEEGALHSALKGVRFALPLSFADQFKIFMNSYSDRNHFPINAVTSDDEMAAVLSLLENSGGDENEDDYDPCKDWKDPSLNDAAHTTLGEIRVSPFSAIVPTIGVGIVAHEIGHVMSENLRRILSEGQSHFLDSLNCVAKRNPFWLEAKTLTVQQDSRWSEEDWADHFSTLVIREMKRQGSPWTRQDLNIGCGLIDSANGFANNKLESNAGDAHSSDLMRLLVIGLERGDLPVKHCAPLLKEAKLENRSGLICHQDLR